MFVYVRLFATYPSLHTEHRPLGGATFQFTSHWHVMFSVFSVKGTVKELKTLVLVDWVLFGRIHFPVCPGRPTALHRPHVWHAVPFHPSSHTHLPLVALEHTPCPVQLYIPPSLSSLSSLSSSAAPGPSPGQATQAL